MQEHQQPKRENYQKMKKNKPDIQYCMHGLGAYKGLRQTNTIEAFKYWYKKGVRIFELDMAITEDGCYVAVAHSVDYKSMKRMEILERPESYSHQWFMRQKLFPLTTKGLSPIDFRTLHKTLDDYPDIQIMLDLFGFFTRNEVAPLLTTLKRTLNNEPRLLEKIIVEAYNIDMAREITNQGIQCIFCARYEYDLGTIDLNLRLNTLKDLGIKYISYPWKYVNTFPDEISEYVKAGMTVFSRTRYNRQTALLAENGVKVNIVDCVFDNSLYPLQLLFYYMQCAKRLVSKKIISYKENCLG